MAKRVVTKVKGKINLNIGAFIVGVFCFHVPLNFIIEVMWDGRVWILLQVALSC